MVWEVYNTVSIPVVGIGGICNARDALEFIIAGASAIQIGTGQFVNPHVTREVIADLKNYLRINRLTTLTDLVGTLETTTGKGP